MKLFDTLMAFLKEFFEKKKKNTLLKKQQQQQKKTTQTKEKQQQKNMQNCPACKEFKKSLGDWIHQAERFHHFDMVDKFYDLPIYPLLKIALVCYKSKPVFGRQQTISFLLVYLNFENHGVFLAEHVILVI